MELLIARSLMLFNTFLVMTRAAGSPPPPLWGPDSDTLRCVHEGVVHVLALLCDRPDFRQVPFRRSEVQPLPLDTGKPWFGVLAL